MHSLIFARSGLGPYDVYKDAWDSDSNCERGRGLIIYKGSDKGNGGWGGLSVTLLPAGECGCVFNFEKLGGCVPAHRDCYVSGV